MKIVTKRRGLVPAVLVLAALAGMAVAQWASAGTPAGDAAIGQAMKGLVQQGVPVKSWSLDGTTLAVDLQSASATAVGTSDDPIYLSMVQREAFLARSRGIDLSELKLTLANTQGQLLFAGNIVLDELLDTAWSGTEAPPEAETTATVRAALAKRTDLSGLTVSQFEVTSKSGGRELRLAAAAADVNAANVSTAALMIGLPVVIDDLNASQGAQIALARVDITDENGKQLLKWIYDVQRRAQDWWQAPGMTTDWFGSPPGPADASAKAQ